VTGGRTSAAAAALASLAAFAALAWLVEQSRTMTADLALRAAIHAWASPALTAAMRLISLAGTEYLLAPLAAIPVWYWAKRGERQRAYLFVAGSLSAEGASELLKILFHRTRPEVFFGLTPAANYSFPSGHAFVSTVYYGLLAILLAAGVWGRAAFITLVLLVGVSRVYLGYHYPSDVVAGWALAAVWLSVCAMFAGGNPPKPN